MKKQASSNPYLEQPCDRCGSKRFVSRVWKESISTFSGTITVDCSQIDCTNVECQRVFDQALKKETEKREEVKRKKEENDVIRKRNALEQLTLRNKEHIS